jgi:ribonuclease HII
MSNEVSGAGSGAPGLRSVPLIPHPSSLIPAPDPWEHERAFWQAGLLRVAGVDEAGRGPLAGPVVAAAVILPPDFNPVGVRDSKKLSPPAREQARERIEREACAVGVGLVEAAEIDRLNILRATHEAMRRALAALPTPADAVLVDGLPVPGLHERCQALVKGDDKSVSVAAASIVAKVTRDAIMTAAHEQFPVYDFGRHKGYPTPDHLRALDEHGPCPLHRRSFGPVAQCCLKFGES